LGKEWHFGKRRAPNSTRMRKTRSRPLAPSRLHMFRFKCVRDSAPASGAIFGILKQTKESFEDELSESDATGGGEAIDGNGAGESDRGSCACDGKGSRFVPLIRFVPAYVKRARGTSMLARTSILSLVTDIHVQKFWLPTMTSQFKIATAFLAQKFWLPPASPRPTFELMTTSLLQKFWLPPVPSGGLAIRVLVRACSPILEWCSVAL